jgi:hypothetical protein
MALIFGINLAQLIPQLDNSQYNKKLPAPLEAINLIPQSNRSFV